MTLYWPVLQARLVALAPTFASGYTPFDGFPAGVEEKGAQKTLSIGASKDDGPGEFQVDQDPVDTFLEESGSVVLEVINWSGDRNVTAKRADAFAVVAALEELLRADPRLGVLPPASTTSLSVSPASLVKDVRLIVSVSYTVRS